MSHVHCARLSFFSFFSLVHVACSNEDDLSVKLTEIIFLNDIIQKHCEQGAKPALIMVRLTELHKPGEILDTW